MTQIEYIKKPSVTTLRAALFRAANAGSTFIQLTWGENQITAEKTRWDWQGNGWIGRVSGYDLVKELNIAGLSK
jgi:hypothetical protein